MGGRVHEDLGVMCYIGEINTGVPLGLRGTFDLEGGGAVQTTDNLDI